MLQNIFRIALRNLKKDGWYSVINILGLTIGITFSTFLILYIIDELSFDKHFKKHERIYRINSHASEPTREFKVATTQNVLGPTLKAEYPEVEEITRLFNRERTLLKKGDQQFYETKIYHADSTYFNVFEQRFIEGNPTTALTKPMSVVITEDIAKKYFGSTTGVVGKTLATAYDAYNITGVVANPKHNTHIRFDMLMSLLPYQQDMGENNWGGLNNYTYVVLKPGADYRQFEQKIQQLYKKYMAKIFEQFNVKVGYVVQPIDDIHMNNAYQGEPEEVGSMSYIYVFGAVAFFMLLIACINYMNLTTARSARRAKEIGIRKVSGSTRSQLATQFLGESFAVSASAVVLSMLLVIILLPYFNSISGKQFTFSNLFNPANLLIFLGALLFTGFVGGSYPALYLSRFAPVGILKGALSKASGNISLRRTLVIVQFSIAIVMIICTWVVFQQLQFVRKKDLGFNQDQLMTLVVNTGKDERPKVASMISDLRDIPGVASVAAANAHPGDPNISLNLFVVETNTGKSEKGIECYQVDEHFVTTMGMQVVKGRDFTSIADTLHSILVNEAMVKSMGWTEALGKRVTFPGDTSGNYLEVVGVLKNFNQKALYNPVEPLILFCSPNQNKVQVKLAEGDVAAMLPKIEKAWKSNFPGLPFEYKFLDDDFNSQYAADQKRGKIFASFSILTVIITCLGLLGLTAFTTEQRQKEISIRRVLGASTYNVVSLISRSYIWLALIAALVAFPVAMYFMRGWLNNFPVNTGLTIWPFLAALFFMLLAALATAAFYSAKAAWAQPAKTLKTE